MMARKLACPSCGVRLKVDASLPVGKGIQCPKCRGSFVVPAVDGETAASKTKAAAARPAPKSVAEPEPEDDTPDEMEERPARKKFRKKKKKEGSKGTLVLVLAVVGLLLAGGALTFAIVYKRSDKKPETVARAETKSESAATNVPPTRSEPTPETSRGGDGMNQNQPAPAPSPLMGMAMRAGMTGTRSAPANPGAGSDESHSMAAGRAVLDNHNCQRCHNVGASGSEAMAGGGRGRGRGPDLSHVGRDSSHTVVWLMDHVRDPKSHRPNSRMPAYGGKISESDLKLLAEYLASLK